MFHDTKLACINFADGYSKWFWLFLDFWIILGQLCAFLDMVRSLRFGCRNGPRGFNSRIGFAVDVSALGRAGFLSDEGNAVCNIGMKTLRLIRYVSYDSHAICPKGNFIDGYLQLLRQNLVQLNWDGSSRQFQSGDGSYLQGSYSRSCYLSKR